MMRHSCFFVLAMLVTASLVGCGASTGTSVTAPPPGSGVTTTVKNEPAKPYDGTYKPDESERAAHGG